VTVRGAVERRGAVTELAAEGLSNRAIADVLGIDDRTVRRDLAGPQSAANAAPDKGPEEGDRDGYAAFAADIPEILREDDIPERVKDAIVLLDSTMRFFHPYRFGGQKVGEYARRKLNDDLAELICLYWSERVWWRGKAPAEWDELEQEWRLSWGLPLDDPGAAP
jgi:hypothetical protein